MSGVGGHYFLSPNLGHTHFNNKTEIFKVALTQKIQDYVAVLTMSSWLVLYVSSNSKDGARILTLWWQGYIFFMQRLKSPRGSESSSEPLSIGCVSLKWRWWHSTWLFTVPWLELRNLGCSLLGAFFNHLSFPLTSRKLCCLYSSLIHREKETRFNT